MWYVSGVCNQKIGLSQVTKACKPTNPWVTSVTWKHMNLRSKWYSRQDQLLYNFKWFITTWLLFIYFSGKSPKTAKIEKKLLPVSTQIGCDVWLTNHLKLYSNGEGTQHSTPRMWCWSHSCKLLWIILCTSNYDFAEQINTCMSRSRFVRSWCMPMMVIWEKECVKVIHAGSVASGCIAPGVVYLW